MGLSCHKFPYFFSILLCEWFRTFFFEGCQGESMRPYRLFAERSFWHKKSRKRGTILLVATKLNDFTGTTILREACCLHIKRYKVVWRCERKFSLLVVLLSLLDSGCNPVTGNTKNRVLLLDIFVLGWGFACWKNQWSRWPSSIQSSVRTLTLAKEWLALLTWDTDFLWETGSRKLYFLFVNSAFRTRI